MSDFYWFVVTVTLGDEIVRKLKMEAQTQEDAIKSAKEIVQNEIGEPDEYIYEAELFEQ